MRSEPEAIRSSLPAFPRPGPWPCGRTSLFAMLRRITLRFGVAKINKKLAHSNKTAFFL